MILIKLIKSLAKKFWATVLRFKNRLTLNSEELELLSNFLIEVAKGILGVPIVIYFISGFSAIALILGFVLDLGVVIVCLGFAIKLKRISKRRKKNE